MKVENVRLQLDINGECVGTLGVENFGVVDAIVTWVRRNPVKFNPVKLSHHTAESFAREELHVQFGGLDSDREIRFKGSFRALKIGDIVSIRVLGPGEVDQELVEGHE